MGHGYIVIQVLYWVELLEQRRLCPIFVKIWIPINGTQQCGIELPEIHRNSTGLRIVNGTPVFCGVIAWYQSLGIRIPRDWWAWV